MADAFDCNAASQGGAGVHESKGEGEADCMVSQHQPQDPASKSERSVEPTPPSREMNDKSMPHSRDFSRVLINGAQSALFSRAPESGAQTYKCDKAVQRQSLY